MNVMPDFLRSTIGALALAVPFGAPLASAGEEPDKVPREQAQGAAQEVARPYPLMVGDRAPELAVSTWLKGAPLEGFEPGKVYVVEFWATWCVPCLASMPHLSKLQDELGPKGLVVAGVTSADTRGNTLAAVTSMVEAKAGVMRYRVAFDAERTANAKWMGDSGRTSIPSSFVVDKQGRIAFIGHPNELDATLRALLDDTFDLERAAKQYFDVQYAERRRLELHARARFIQTRIGTASQNKEWPTVLAGYDELIGLDPVFADYSVHKFKVLLTSVHDYDAAYTYALEAAANLIPEDGPSLVRMALVILDARDIEVRDCPIALALALQADDVLVGKDALTADTLAKSFFCLDDLESAVEAQRRAVALATPPTLERYRIPLQRYEDLLAAQRREREERK